MSAAINPGCDPEGPAPRAGSLDRIAETPDEMTAELHRFAAHRWDKLTDASKAYFAEIRNLMEFENWAPEAKALAKEYNEAAIAMVQSYGFMHCFAAFHRAAPTEAAAFVTSFGLACDAGDSFGEWIWSIGENIVKGEPLHLPGDPWEDES